MSAFAPAAPRLFRVRTPERVALPFTVASIGDRLGAFLLDLLISGGGIAIVVVLAAIVLRSREGALGAFFLADLAVPSCYFVACEVGWGGKTLGKQAFGLRVIARDGGPLTAGAGFARNLMREVELFLPLALLFAGQTVVEGPPGLALVAGAWFLLFLALPFFGRERLRAGDLVAGTVVVHLPRALLLPDLAVSEPTPAAFAPGHGDEPGDEIVFTAEQLDHYGIEELHVLEDVLRRRAAGTLDPGVLEDIGERIQRKIAWPADRRQVPTPAFLEAFYRAQRGRLERKLLFGERRERKRK